LSELTGVGSDFFLSDRSRPRRLIPTALSIRKSGWRLPTNTVGSGIGDPPSHAASAALTNFDSAIAGLEAARREAALSRQQRGGPTRTEFWPLRCCTMHKVHDHQTSARGPPGTSRDVGFCAAIEGQADTKCA
jgi:hypothetical protein